MKVYFEMPLREILKKEQRLIQISEQRAEKIRQRSLKYRL
jgi:hypothetical protein